MSSLLSYLASFSASHPILFPVSALVLILLSSALFMGVFTSSNSFQPAGKHCYIGGGSEGLGLALACQLAEKGAHVSIVSRSEGKLQKALEEIETHRQSPSQKFASYSCDLTSPASSASTIRLACEPFASHAPDFIFACAGGSKPMLFTEMSAEEHINCLDWNFRTSLCTVHEGVKMMKQEAIGDRETKEVGGKIVLTASVLAMMGFAGYSTYTPGKYAIRGLADSLRNELLLYGISVHLFLPATILSPGFDKENETKPEICRTIEGRDEGLSPERVAQELIKGLERNDYYITYEPVGHMLRTSRGPAPWNNFFFDAFWGIAGTIGLPIWRMMEADAAVKKEAKKLRSGGK